MALGPVVGQAPAEEGEDVRSRVGRPFWTRLSGQASRSRALGRTAAATVAGVDVLASWNSRHMVNLSRIRAYNEVNRVTGCPPVDIRSPQELENEE